MLAEGIGGKAGGIGRLLLLAADAKRGCGDMQGAADTCEDFARRAAADPGYAAGQSECEMCCRAIMGSFPGLGGFDHFACASMCAKF